MLGRAGRICFAGHAYRFPPADLTGLELPYPLLPARLRRFYETDVMTYLAGGIAEALHAARDAPTEVPAPEPAPDVTVAALPPREAAVLEEAAACGSHASDVTKAFPDPDGPALRR